MTILTRIKPRQGTLVLTLTLALLLSQLVGTAVTDPSSGKDKHPNILFFIMDDVGIDQMRIFGYGGETPPRTPNIDTIAHAGVRFRNTWATPECTPSRAMFFEGRYPFRTNILNVITSAVLANSQVSPFEATTPKLLKDRHYDSAMFGKFHLAGPDNNPYGNGGPHALGWDFFYGFIEGAPHPIDTTAGGVAAENTYQCGFVNDAAQAACNFSEARPCMDTLPVPAPGRTCLERGGLFVPQASCQSSPPGNLNFNTLNAYYVSPLVINHPDGTVEQVQPTDPRARGYRTTLEVNAARDWIRQRPAHTPWMATVSFSSAHAPYQQPPTALLPPASVDTNSFNCIDLGQQRVLSNQMIESLDSELGRLLVELGLATRKPTGELDYHPEATDTMVVIIGDNGTFAPGVKAPFDPNHSKATAYQTGVWVPLIVAGPPVKAPDREVTHMVNVADLFALFGEIAGIDVRKAVPKSHALDAVSMLPYLTNPSQESLRTTNFTQYGVPITANGVQPPPCVVTVTSPPTCVQIFPQQALCEFEGGTWYGPGGAAGPDGLKTCCDVVNLVPNPYPGGVTLLPDSERAIRNDRFKLLQQEVPNCTTRHDDLVTEFYEIDELAPIPRIDRPDGPLANNLLTSPNLPPQGLNPVQLANFNVLYAELQTLLDSEPPCPGDGNLDKKVDGKDLVDWKFFSALSGGQSSWYDVNLDGKTDEADRAIIVQHLGTNCLK